MGEEYSLLRVNDFELILLKANGLLEELKQETTTHKKSPKEVDQAVISKVTKLINIITENNFLGVPRFNQITEHLRP